MSKREFGATGRHTLANMLNLPLLIITLVLQQAGPTAWAETKHWEGDVNGYWNTAGNWFENAVPANGDLLVFSAGARYISTNNMSGLRLDSVVFGAGGYNVRGNAFTITNGITSEPAAPASPNEVDNNITLGASQTFRCGNASLYLMGQIDLGTNTLTVYAPAVAEVMIGSWSGTGRIIGTGGITKDGPGTLILAGSSATSTYSGLTRVKDGLLLLGRGTVPAIPGPGELTIGDGIGSPGSAVVRYAGGDQVAARVAVDSDGLLDLAGYSDTIAATLTLDEGVVQTGTGTLTLPANATVLVHGYPTISGKLNVGTGTCTINGTSAHFDLEATVSGSADINVVGDDMTLVLASSNSFTGILTANNAGSIIPLHPMSFGATNGGTVINTPAKLVLQWGIGIASEALAMNSSQTPAVAATSGANTWGGPVTLGRDTIIEVASSTSLNLKGSIAGGGGLIKTGPGSLTYSGHDNSYTGTTRVNQGELLLNTVIYNSAFAGPLVIGDGSGSNAVARLRMDTEIPDNVPLTINAGGLLDLNGWNETIGNLILDQGGSITVGTATLALSGDVSVTGWADSTITGSSGTLNLPATRTFGLESLAELYIYVAITGPGGLTKTGDGQLRLLKPNTYSGLTLIQDGSLSAETHSTLGDTNAATVVKSPARLRIRCGFGATNETLQLEGTLEAPDSGPVTWAGPITFTADSTIYVGQHDTTFLVAGIVDGARGMTKTGNGTLTFAGHHNAYAGMTRVNSGTLLLNVWSYNCAVGGSLVIGDGLATNALVRLLLDTEIPDGTSITINAGGLLDLNSLNDTVGPITLAGGDVVLGTATLSLNGNVTALSTESVITGRAGTLNLPATRTFDVTNGVFFDVQPSVTGSGGITKSGQGWLRLASPNAYSGPTAVAQGHLEVAAVTSLGATASGTVVSNGASLILSANGTVAGESLTLNGYGYAGYGALDTGGSTATNAWTGPITLNSDSLIIPYEASSSLFLSGSISGVGALIQRGPGNLYLQGDTANTYGGATRVDSGTLWLGKSGADRAIPGNLIISGTARLLASEQIANTANITINDGGDWLFNGWNETIGNSLTLNGDAMVDTGDGLLTLGNDSVVTAYPTNSWCDMSGYLNVGSGSCQFNVAVGGDPFLLYASVSGSAPITKLGPGELNLRRSNSFTGPLNIAAGLVQVNHRWSLGATTAGTTISNQASLAIAYGNDVHVAAEPLTIHSTNAYAALDSYGSESHFRAASNSWEGDIILAAPSVVRVLSNGWFNLLGSISGPGGITEVGGGTLYLSGSADNTHTGDTFVKEGILNLNKSGNRWAISGGTLLVGDGQAADRADVVRYTGTSTDQIWNVVPIVITNAGLLDLNGHSDTLGAITLCGGDITLGTGLLGVGASVSVLKSGSDLDGPGGTVHLPGTRTFHVAGGVVFYLRAPLSGPGSLTKAGAGWMYLDYPGSYSGLTRVEQGILAPWDARALGATTSGTIVSGGATLELRGGLTYTDEALTLNGSGILNYGALDLESGAVEWTGPITLNADSTILAYDELAGLTVSGTIGGAGSLDKMGSGTLALAGTNANVYAGPTRVTKGKLRLAKPPSITAVPSMLIVGDGAGGANADVVEWGANHQVADTADLLVNSSGLVFMPTNTEQFGSIGGSGNIDLGSAGGLQFGVNPTNTTFSGIISGGGGAIFKGGSSTVTFSGNNTYGGYSYVMAGTLRVNGCQPQSPVWVGVSGTLGGTGTVGIITAEGNLAPGASPGLLTTSNVTFTTSADYYVELNGAAPGVGYDQLKVQGSAVLGSAILHATLGFPSAVGNSFTIIDNDGAEAVNGAFVGLAEGATVYASGTPFRISYTGGTGNDVVLTQLTETQRPFLGCARANLTNIVLWWPTNFTGYVLDATTNLDGGGWSAVPATPVLAGTNRVVTEPANQERKFYRLRVP